MISEKRLFLVYGWAKAAAMHLVEIHRIKNVISGKRKEGNWAIAVADDDLALQFQRLDFMEHRILYAVGLFGLKSEATLGKDGWRWRTQEEIDNINRQTLANYRRKAHRGRHLPSPWTEDEFYDEEMA